MKKKVSTLDINSPRDVSVNLWNVAGALARPVTFKEP